MARVIDLEARRPSLTEKRRDAKAAEMRDAFRDAREGADDGIDAKSKSARKLLDIYRSRKPRKR